MRSTITVAASVLAVLLLAAPASAQRTTCKNEKLLARYSGNYHAVRNLHGSRAPGRNIRKWGLSATRPSKCSHLRKSLETLRRMRMPVRVAVYLKPTRPYHPPAQTATLRATGAPLAAIRQCESGGNYATNTGNGFYGAYQFTLGTWRSVGGSGNPAAASPAEQDRRAAILHARSGASPWPVCGR